MASAAFFGEAATGLAFLACVGIGTGFPTGAATLLATAAGLTAAATFGAAFAATLAVTVAGLVDLVLADGALTLAWTLLFVVVTLADFSGCMVRAAGVATLAAGLTIAFATVAFFTAGDLAAAALGGVFFF
jgi:hypothetical protein